MLYIMFSNLIKFCVIVNSFCECGKILRLCALFLPKAENLNKEMLYLGTDVFKVKSALVRRFSAFTLCVDYKLFYISK